MRRLLLIALLAACSKKPEPKPAPPAEPSAPAPAARESPQVYDPNAPFPGSERLQGILAQMQAEGAPFGVEIAVGHLRGRFESKTEEWSALAVGDAKYAGVAEPEIRDFDENDQAHRGPRFKWSTGEGVKYGDRLPAEGDGVVEAWARVYGFRDMSGGGVIMTMNNVPADKWRRMQWQPTRKRWWYFNEAEDESGRRTLIETRLTKINPDWHRSTKFALERSTPYLREAESKGQDAQGIRDEMRKAILEGWSQEITLEAARWALER